MLWTSNASSVLWFNTQTLVRWFSYKSRDYMPQHFNWKFFTRDDSFDSKILPVPIWLWHWDSSLALSFKVTLCCTCWFFPLMSYLFLSQFHNLMPVFANLQHFHVLTACGCPSLTVRQSLLKTSSWRNYNTSRGSSPLGFHRGLITSCGWPLLVSIN